MTNEMKLIMALCDALGFDVEETPHYNYRLVLKEEADLFADTGYIDDRRLTMVDGRFLVNNKGMYQSELIKPEITYKLVKR